MSLRSPVARMAVYILLVTARQMSYAGPTGLNSIPTTDIVPLNNWIAYFQNGNTQFKSPAFYSAPALMEQTQFALSSKVEAGVDSLYLQNRNANEFVLNIKSDLQNEDDIRPNAAIGVENIANHIVPSFYITLSKTLNYYQEQKERFRAHHRRNRKLLGRRVHIGLMADARGTLEPFAGADLQMSESLVFQTDWINGSGNAITLGTAYVLPDQKTVFTPAILFSNSSHRFNGFFLNISRQLSL